MILFSPGTGLSGKSNSGFPGKPPLGSICRAMSQTGPSVRSAACLCTFAQSQL
jgi:hypothetical protein